MWTAGRQGALAVAGLLTPTYAERNLIG